MATLSLWQQFVYYYQHNGAYVLAQINRTFLISVYGVLFAAVIGIPVGIFISRNARLGDLVVEIANFIQTIPSLALLSIVMVGMGLGVMTVIFTVTLYSLLPIIKNTYTGMKNVDHNVIDSGKGMGMTRLQLLYLVRLPLSLSVIIAGLKNALVIAIGITSIGSFVGAGGLGDIIIRGTNATNGSAIILAGALPTALMAILADTVLNFAQKLLQPKGLSK
ncbi:ABC transporter permease [Lactobacillus xylocopicola]|uniref:Amino acid ABC transporter permease n=1 Tax=Lactobacillus xylocopicola TaxID=2976676 RepID=A0ABM8BG50_9LACO|nr:ABC transporter permease [Lactobacillus xylocopicola]BDR60236.1 amino acid ABC transporter permease [Lactobacillus xylocopicola]